MIKNRKCKKVLATFLVFIMMIMLVPTNVLAISDSEVENNSIKIGDKIIKVGSEEYNYGNIIDAMKNSEDYLQKIYYKKDGKWYNLLNMNIQSDQDFKEENMVPLSEVFGQEPGVEFPRAVLVGDFVESIEMGDNWNPSNYRLLMRMVEKNIYELTLDMKAGTFNYKAAMNGTWDVSYGDNGNNKVINVPEDMKVKFRLDTNEQTIKDSLNDKDDFEKVGEVDGSISLIGTIRSNDQWTADAKGYEFIRINDSKYYIFNGIFNKGDYEYKGIENYSWDGGGLPSSGNINISIQEDNTHVVIIANMEERSMFDSINNNKEIEDILNGSVVKPPVVPEVESPVINENGTVTFNYYDKTEKATVVSLAGSMTNWGDGRESMTKGENNIWSITKDLDPGKYQYKFIVNEGGWTTDPSNEREEGGNSLLIVPGFYSINFPNEILQKTTTGAIALNLNPDGSTGNIPNEEVTWGVANNTSGSAIIFSIEENGKVSAGRIPEGMKEFEGVITAIVNDNALVKTFKITKELKEVPGGRKVVLAGTIQSVMDEGNWTPGSDKTRMLYRGNGLYELIVRNVPAGGYEYKVAMGSWDENYGANGVPGGDNMKLSVPSMMDVTFWYSDVSNKTVNSLEYVKANVKLKGSAINSEIQMEDYELTGAYSTEVTLDKGSYDDFIVTVDGREIRVDNIVVEEDKKTFKIFYSPILDYVYTNLVSGEIDKDKIMFDSKDSFFKVPFGAIKEEEEGVFKLKTGKEILKAMLVVSNGSDKRIIDMNAEESDDEKVWEGRFSTDRIGMYEYYFVVFDGSKPMAYGDDDGYFGTGRVSELQNVQKYQLNVYKSDFKTPDWMKNGIAYQIFPDRFFNGNRSNDQAQKTSRGNTDYQFPTDWYEIPENNNVDPENGDGIWHNEMYGGDIAGIDAKLDYLHTLGVTVIYINPIGASISSHRYDTTDYAEVDPLLGNMDEFIEFAEKAEARGMKVVLDGVFNHVSDDSVYFDRYGKYKEAGKPLGAYLYWEKVWNKVNDEGLSKEEAVAKAEDEFKSEGINDFRYAEWFNVENEYDDSVGHYKYEGWWGFDSMPVIKSLNGSEYSVKSWADEIIDGEDSITRLWLKNGSDGWRLDVANEVSDETWQNFRKAVKEEGDNVIIGEIWDDASKYILGDMYDSVMNYRFGDTVVSFIRNGNDDMDAGRATRELEKIREQYPREAFQAMLNLVDSHDTPRAISKFDGITKDNKVIAPEPSQTALNKMRLVPLIQMTYAGTPCIYYGDEMGTAGAHDPDNRRTTIWGKGNKELVEWYAKLGGIRNKYEVLRTGNTIPRDINNGNVLAYERVDQSNRAIIFVNRNMVVEDISIEGLVDGEYRDALTGMTYVVSDGKLNAEIPAFSGIILVKNYEEVDVDYSKLRDAYDPAYIVENR